MGGRRQSHALQDQEQERRDDSGKSQAHLCRKRFQSSSKYTNGINTDHVLYFDSNKQLSWKTLKRLSLLLVLLLLPPRSRRGKDRGRIGPNVDGRFDGRNRLYLSSGEIDRTVVSHLESYQLLIQPTLTPNIQCRHRTNPKKQLRQTHSLSSNKYQIVGSECRPKPLRPLWHPQSS